MSLTLTALKWMIALAIVALAIQVFAASLGEASSRKVAVATVNVLVLWAFFFALRKPIKWLAYVALPLCIFDFFGAISQGFSFANSLNLLDAVLSFVASCGLVIWINEQRRGLVQ